MRPGERLTLPGLELLQPVPRSSVRNGGLVEDGERNEENYRHGLR